MSADTDLILAMRGSDGHAPWNNTHKHTSPKSFISRKPQLHLNCNKEI